MEKMMDDLIAPCGMNCMLCMAYRREKDHCCGCRNENDIKYKTKSSDSCIIRNCYVYKNSDAKYCFSCEKFPCQRLKQLDKRYRTKYHMSMIENLDMIKLNGIERFLLNEEAKWTCKKCGDIICVHKHVCLSCKTSYID